MPKVVNTNEYRVTYDNGRVETFFASLVVAQQSGALFVYNQYADATQPTLVGTYGPVYRKFERVGNGTLIAQD